LVVNAARGCIARAVAEDPVSSVRRWRPALVRADNVFVVTVTHRGPRVALEHHRDEETEHAMMLLEWLRRRRPAFAANIEIYLGKEGPIAALEAAADGEAAAPPGETADTKTPHVMPPRLTPPRSGGSLGVGSLRGA
jgi:hypothetical protein